MREDLALRDEAGRRHLRHHEARVEPSLLDEERGQVREGRVDELLDAALRDRRQVRRRDRGVVEDEPDRRPVEVAARDDVARAPRKRAGCPSRCSSRARGPPARGRRRRVPRRAPAACSAGRSCPARGRSRGGIRGSRCRRAAPGGWPRSGPPRGAGARATILRSKAASDPREASSDAAPTRSAARERAIARWSARPPTATDICTPLMSASPSLAARATGRRRADLSAAAAGLSRPRTRTRPSPMSPSARCASGARSPEAPTEPCDGMTGRTSAASMREQGFDRRDADARVAAGERVGAQGDHRAHRRVRKRRADAGAVAPDQVALQALELGPRNRHVGELPEPGRDAVDGRTRPNRPVDHPARGRDRPPGPGRERDANRPSRDGDEIVQGETLALEPYDLHCVAILS